MADGREVPNEAVGEREGTATTEDDAGKWRAQWDRGLEHFAFPNCVGAAA